MDYTLYTYGSGEFLAKVFETLKYLFAGGFAISLLKIFAIVSVLTALVTWGLRLLGSTFVGDYNAVSDDYSNASGILAILRTGILAVIATTIFINPVLKVPLVIEDRYEPSQSRVVDDVPWGFAFLSSTLSQIGDKLGEGIETMLAPVDGVKMMDGGGIGVGPKFLNYFLKLDAPGSPSEYGQSGNVPIKGVIDAWFAECIYPHFAVIDGEGVKAQALRALATSGYLLGDMAFMVPPFVDPNTPLSVQFYGEGETNETTCANATTQILDKWNTVFEPWLAREAAPLFNKREDDSSVVYRVYEIVDRYFPDSNYSTWERIAQLAMINSAFAAYTKFSAEYGSMGAQDLAVKRQTESWMQMARIGAKSLFVMRQVAEAVIYLFGAIMPIFIVTAGIGVIFKYIKAVFWLQLWIPIFAIFNALGDYHMAKSLNEIAQCVGGSCSVPLNFETVDKIRSTTNFILGYLGILTMSAPMFAWGLLRIGSEVAGGVAGAILPAREAGGTAAASITEKTGAMTSYSAGSMKASAGAAASAGIAMQDAKFGFHNLAQMRQVELGYHMAQTMTSQTGGILAAIEAGASNVAEAGYIQGLETVGSKTTSQSAIKSTQQALSLAYGREVDTMETAGWMSAGGKAVLTADGQGYFVSGAGFGNNDFKMYVGNNGEKYVTDWGGGFKGYVGQGVTLQEAKAAIMKDEVGRNFAVGKTHQFFSGQTAGFSEKTSKALTETATEEMGKQIAQHKSLSEKLGITDQTTTSTSHKVSTGIDAGKIVKLLSGGAVDSPIELKYTMESGKTVATITDKTTNKTISLDESETQALKQAYQTVMTKTTEKTLTTSQGFQDYVNLARNENATAAKAMETAYRDAEYITKNFQGDLSAMIGNLYAKEVHGGITPESIAKTQRDFAIMQATGDYSTLYERTGLTNAKELIEKVKGNFNSIGAEVTSKTQQLDDKTRGAGNVQTGGMPDVQGPREPNTIQYDTAKQNLDRVEQKFDQAYQGQSTFWGQQKRALKNLAGGGSAPNLNIDKGEAKQLDLERKR